MRTIGRRHKSGERGNALCDRCGTRWPRSSLRRDLEGLLNCPQEGPGRDATALTKANVASAKAYAHSYDRPVKYPGAIDKETTTAEKELQAWEPTDVPGYVLNLNPYQNVFTTTNALGVTVVSCFGSVVGKNNNPFVNSTLSWMPAWEPNGWVAATSGIARPSLAFDGVNDYLECVTSAGPILTGGSNKAFTIFVVAQLISVAANTILGPLVSTGRLSNSVAPIWNLSNQNGTWVVLKRGDTGAAVSLTGGTADTIKSVFEVAHSGLATQLSVRGITVAFGTQSTSPLNGIDAMTLGKSTRSSGTNSLCNFRLARVLGFDRALGVSDQTYIRSKLAEIYF